MPKSRAEDMKKSRQRRKDSGLVEFRCWCTPEEKAAIEVALNDMRRLSLQAYKCRMLRRLK